LAVAKPRPRTLEALAATLGVDSLVLTGELPFPDLMANAEPPAALDAPPTASGRSPAPPVQVADVGEVRRQLRIAVRDAVRSAVAGGVSPEMALADAVQAALMGSGWLG
jgi:hypothetical protein